MSSLDALHSLRGSIQSVRNAVFVARRKQLAGQLDPASFLDELERMLSGITEREPPRPPVEDPVKVLRHDLRNKLAAIRNAAFFLKRRVETSPLWSSEKKVPLFFGMIDEQLDKAETILGIAKPSGPPGS